jgi:hypothetical protein
VYQSKRRFKDVFKRFKDVLRQFKDVKDVLKTFISQTCFKDVLKRLLKGFEVVKVLKKTTF